MVNETLGKSEYCVNENIVFLVNLTLLDGTSPLLDDKSGTTVARVTPGIDGAPLFENSWLDNPVRILTDS